MLQVFCEKCLLLSFLSVYHTNFISWRHTPYCSVVPVWPSQEQKNLPKHAEEKERVSETENMRDFFVTMMMMLIVLCCVEIHALSPVVMIPGLAGSVIKAKLHDAYVLNCVSRTTHSLPSSSSNTHKLKHEHIKFWVCITITLKIWFKKCEYALGCLL